MGTIYGVARVTAGYELFESGDKTIKIQDFGFFNPKSTTESTAASIDAPATAPNPQEGEQLKCDTYMMGEFQWSPSN